jgi:hypothetical protein
MSNPLNSRFFSLLIFSGPSGTKDFGFFQPHEAFMNRMLHAALQILRGAKFRRAVHALRRLHRYSAKAKGAVASCGRRWSGLRSETIHLAHQQEYSKGDDQEINDRVQEETIIQSRCARRFCRCDRGVMRLR